MEEIRGLDDEALADLARKVVEEQERRQLLAEAESRMQEIDRRWEEEAFSITTSFLNARDGEGDTKWVQPTGAHDAYPKGWTVIWEGKTWESTVAHNVHEPGVSGWREVSADGTPVAWVAPTGAHDAYEKGHVVTHNGKTWQSNVEANVWEPPEQWTEIDPILPPSDGEDEPVPPVEEPEPPIEQPDPEPEPEEPSVPEWSPTATYKIGDLVALDGKIWECLAAHGAEYQGTWKPGVAHSVWRDVTAQAGRK